MVLAGAIRRHERALIVAWLASCAALLAAIGAWGIRPGGAERVIDSWNERWVVRLSHGRKLVTSGQFEEAAAYLERLDRGFPVNWVKHRHDRKREELLELLGTSHAELDRKRRCLEAFERLVEFDPRNWRNHFLLGEYCRRFAEAGRAEKAYQGVLAIHPSHLPSVEALIGAEYDAGLFAAVRPLFEAYLDAWLLGRMNLSLGGVDVALEVAVDGRPHTVEVPLELSAGWGGELCLATHGYSVRVSTVELVAPLRVGVAGSRDSVVVRGDAAWEGRGVQLVEPSVWAALGPETTICTSLPDGDVARVLVTLTAFKACPAELHEQVQRSYANQLADEAWDAVSARTVVGGCLEAGSVFTD